MTKKRKLADILWDAANDWLDTPDDEWATPKLWSCNAVLWSEFGASICDPAYARNQIEPLRKKSVATEFLSTLGCKPDQPANFGGNKDHPQGLRYMWLLLAMHVAEDEGIEV